MPSERERLFEARYGDGRSAASHRATVGLTPAGLAIILTAGGEQRLWPYREIEAATPITAGDKDVLLRRIAAPGKSAVADDPSEVGATLFVRDAAFVQGLLGHQPGLRGSAQRWKFAAPGLVVMGALAVFILGAWASGMSPIRSIAGLIPDRAWQTIGDQAAQSLTGGRRTCTHPEAIAALDRLMRKLSTAAGTTEQFDARIVDWNLLNAFALPGKRIVLTRQLITTVGSGDELAGVIAHEMGHGIARHPEVSITRGIGLMAGAKLLLGGGAETLGNVGLLLLQLRYTRDAEREADASAVAILREARIPARALAMFFERLKKDDGGRARPGAPEILSTHPSLDDRLKEIERLPTYAVEPAVSAAEFEALRKACAI